MRKRPHGELGRRNPGSRSTPVSSLVPPLTIVDILVFGIRRLTTVAIVVVVVVVIAALAPLGGYDRVTDAVLNDMGTHLLGRLHVEFTQDFVKVGALLAQNHGSSVASVPGHLENVAAECAAVIKLRDEPDRVLPDSQVVLAVVLPRLVPHWC